MSLLNNPPAQVTAVAGAVVCNDDAGIVTTEALSTAAGATYTLVIGNNQVEMPQRAAVVLASICNGTNTAGDPDIQSVTPGQNKITIVVINRHASNAFNGTLKISFTVDN